MRLRKRRGHQFFSVDSSLLPLCLCGLLFLFSGREELMTFGFRSNFDHHANDGLRAG